MRSPLDTIIFDLDGTLYDDVRVYDRYAHELSLFLPAHRQERYLAEWTAAQEGRSAARVGLGYDETTDRLFRYAGERILSFIDWNGRPAPATVEKQSSVAPKESRQAQEDRPAIETPIFGPERFNIGDWWGLPDALAAHYGVRRDERAQAFLATRACMDSDSFPLQREPGLYELLHALHAARWRLVAMSNSPAETTHAVIRKLGLHDCFTLIAPASQKPRGLTHFLEQAGAPGRILSIGDNYVNDIEPALRAGCGAVYIDRHDTGLGAGFPACQRVYSIQAALAWLSRNR